MLRGDGCDFGRQEDGRFSDERCIAGTGAAVSGDEAGCAALGSGDGTGVVRGKTARGHTRSSMSHYTSISTCLRAKNCATDTRNTEPFEPPHIPNFRLQVPEFAFGTHDF